MLPALAALELMHTFALVHDDVMDESATRRGAPTAHRIFAGEHIGAGRLGDPDHFGATAAILVGDLCLVWADQLLARTPLSTATLFAVRACYDRMRIEAVAGQYLDVLGETQPDAWSVERALLVARHKTASYTVQRPLQFGMALAGPDACTDGRRRWPTWIAPTPVRRRGRRGVPAPRRPARRVRRPGGHRQAGRRRPAHRQADRAAHAGPPARHARPSAPSCTIRRPGQSTGWPR